MSLIAQKLISASGGETESIDPDFNLVTQLYQFDGTNGAQNNTFLDSSSNGFTVTRAGSSTQGTFSPFSSEEGKWSVYFDGSSNYQPLSVATSNDIFAQTSDFTLEFFYFGGGRQQTLIDTRSGLNTDTAITIYMNSSGQVGFYAAGADRIAPSSSSVVVGGTWNHIALARSSSVTNMWINGSLAGSVSDSYDYANTNNYKIGGPAASISAYHVQGHISNYRFIKGTALYSGSGSITVPTSYLTAVTNTKLLCCQSNRYKDNSTVGSVITPSSSAYSYIQPLSPFAPSAAYDPAVNGGSGYFSATADYASIAASSDFDVLSNGTFTIDFWFYRTDALGLYADYVGIFNGVSSGVLLYQYSTGFHVYINGSTVFNVTHPALNQWVHVALTRDGTTLRLALNGVLQASSTASLGTSNYPLNIAGDSTGRAGFQGYISDVRVVKGTRVYASNFTPPTAPSTAITNTEALLSFTNAAMFDQTGKTNIETVGNAQLNTSIKKFGSASAKFDESGDYLIVRNAPLLGGGDFTIEGFVYFNSSPTDGQGLFVYDSQSLGNRAGYGPALGTYAHAPYDGKWHSYYGTQATPGTGTQGNSEATPSATTWIHFAYVRTSGVIKIFIGGSQIGSDIAWTGNYTANDVLTIAGYYSTSYLLNGYIDSYRVTLKARYTSNFTPPSEEFPNR